MKLRYVAFIGLLAVVVAAYGATGGAIAQTSTQQYSSTTQSEQGMSSSPPAVSGSGPTAAPPAYGYSRPGESPGAGAGTGMWSRSDQQTGTSTAPGATMAAPDQSSTYRSYRSESSTSTVPQSTVPSETSESRRAMRSTGTTMGSATGSFVPDGSGPTAAPPAWGYSRPGESPGTGAGTGLSGSTVTAPSPAPAPAP